MTVLKSHNTALTELRKESEELYQAAIQPDDSLLSNTLIGPVQTPPIKNYQSPAEYRSENTDMKFCVVLFLFNFQNLL